MKKKKQKKDMFWIDWGTFPPDTLVVVGYSDMNEVLKTLRKKKEKEWSLAVELKEKSAPFPKGSHFFSSFKIEKGEKPVNFSVLFLKDWKNDIEHYKILAHELVHGISFLMPDFLDPMEENEAFAYQHSFLFEQIANRLKKL